MHYFDFHVHPALKAQFQDVEKRSGPWEVYKVGLSIIDWQGSFTQLTKGNVRLTGIALHVPEPHMNSELLRVINSKSLFERIFKIFIASVLKMIKALLSNARLTALADLNVNSYEVLLQELDNIERNKHKPGSNDELIFLTNKAAYDASKPKTIYGFFVIEGLHCFKGSHPMNTAAGLEEIKANLTHLCTRQDLRVLAVNLAHLQYNHFCNHAFGVKMFNDSKFYADGNGIDDPGAVWEIVEMLYNRNILVDIKHMSVKARHEFYSGRKQRGYTLPLICTHAGVAGISRGRAGYYVYEKPKKKPGAIRQVAYMKPLGIVHRTSFNISSINLYDEDIIEIIASGGLIGISLDRRIVGFTEYFDTDEIHDIEYLSKGEYSFLFDDAEPSRDWQPDEVLTPVTHTIEEKQNYITLDARYFLNQVLYILKLAEAKGDDWFNKALRSICIGSDFDGMIDSLFCCRTAVDYPLFYTIIGQQLPEAAREAGIALEKIPTLIDDVFVNNGRNFVLQHIDAVNVN